MSISAVLLDFAVKVIDRIGYVGVGLMLLLDNVGVPIPSEAVLALSGAAARAGSMNLVVVIVLGIVLQTAGSSLAYWVGRVGGTPLIKRYGKYVLVSQEDFEKTQAWFAKRGPRAIFISRLTPVVRTFMGFAAGAAGMDAPSFVIQSLAGSVLWTLVWTGFGYILGDSWRHYYEYMHYVDYVVLVLVILAVGHFVWRHLKRRKRSQTS